MIKERSLRDASSALKRYLGATARGRLLSEVDSFETSIRRSMLDLKRYVRRLGAQRREKAGD